MLLLLSFPYWSSPDSSLSGTVCIPLFFPYVPLVSCKLPILFGNPPEAGLSSIVTYVAANESNLSLICVCFFHNAPIIIHAAKIIKNATIHTITITVVNSDSFFFNVAVSVFVASVSGKQLFQLSSFGNKHCPLYN